MSAPGPSASTVLHRLFYAGRPERDAGLRQAREDAGIAQQIHDLRTKHGLSQRALAVRVGTTASVICRLEDADYGKQSLAMLRRIAAALGQSVKVVFVPEQRDAGAGRQSRRDLGRAARPPKTSSQHALAPATAPAKARVAH